VLTDVTTPLLPVAVHALVKSQIIADAEKAAELKKPSPHSAHKKTKPLGLVFHVAALAVYLKSGEMFSSFYFVLENHIVRYYLV